VHIDKRATEDERIPLLSSTQDLGSEQSSTPGNYNMLQ